MNETIWTILGVAPGSDRATVRRAYARKLKLANPEDDPAGFTTLRNAYEVALRIALERPSQPLPPKPDPASDDQPESDEIAQPAQGVLAGLPLRQPSGAGRSPRDEPSDEQAPSGVASWEGSPVQRQTEMRPSADIGDGHRRQDEMVELSRPAPASRPPLWIVKPALEAREPRPDPREGLRDAMDKLAALLSSTAAADAPALMASFERVLALPAMEQLGLRVHVENQLADLIAAHIPRSDPLIAAALEAFGSDWRPTHHAAARSVAVMLARRQEITLIAAFNRPKHVLGDGWRSLTSPPLASWRMRLNALQPGLRRQAARLLQIASTEMPRLRHSFDEGSAAWWRRYFARARLTLGVFLLWPFGLLLASTLSRAAARDGLPAEPVLWLFVALVAASPYLLLRVQQARIDREQVGWKEPQWLRQAWIPALAALPVAAMILPAATWGAVVALGTATTLSLWIVFANPPAVIDKPTADSISGFAVRWVYPVIMLTIIASSMVDELQRKLGSARAVQLMCCGMVMIVAAVKGRAALGAPAPRYWPNGRMAFASAFMIACAATYALTTMPNLFGFSPLYCSVLVAMLLFARLQLRSGLGPPLLSRALLLGGLAIVFAIIGWGFNLQTALDNLNNQVRIPWTGSALSKFGLPQPPLTRIYRMPSGTP